MYVHGGRDLLDGPMASLYRICLTNIQTKLKQVESDSNLSPKSGDKLKV